jgi:hypothetical protein
MVNGWFPDAAIYGFEMVDAPHLVHPALVSGHQSKIYGESIQANFPRFFGGFTSMQILPIYRPLLSLRPIAASTAQEAKDKIDDRDRAMFFLLRLAFWLGLVLVLLPRDKTPESDKVPQISASDAVSAATSTINDMGQFCKRQPAACEVGGQAATAIGQRATDGARKLYQIITDKKPPDHTGSIGGDDAASAIAASRDTLTADDQAIEFRLPPTP